MEILFVEFYKHNDALLTYFIDERSEEEHWIRRVIREDGHAFASKAFTLKQEDIVEEKCTKTELAVKIGSEQGDYWSINKDILGINYSLLIHKECNLGRKHFIAEKGVSIFPMFNGI